MRLSMCARKIFLWRLYCQCLQTVSMVRVSMLWPRRLLTNGYILAGIIYYRYSFYEIKYSSVHHTRDMSRY